MKDDVGIIVKKIGKLYYKDKEITFAEACDLMKKIPFMIQSDYEELVSEINDHICRAAIKNSENGLCQRYCRICGEEMKENSNITESHDPNMADLGKAY